MFFCYGILHQHSFKVITKQHSPFVFIYFHSISRVIDEHIYKLNNKSLFVIHQHRIYTLPYIITTVIFRQN